MLLSKIINISRYFPITVKNTKKFIKIAESENPEFNMLWKELDNLLSNQFINTLTEYGVLRWEKILKINPKEKDTLEDRKIKIILNIYEKLPYTITVLKEMLEDICGKDGYTINIIHNKYLLIVKICLEKKYYFNEVNDLLKRIIPANMILDFDLIYNTHETMSLYTHKHLNHFKHKEMKAEVLYNVR